MLSAFHWYELAAFAILYSFLGWVIEVICCVVTRREFCNRGVLTLPFLPSYGITFLLLILVLPTFGSNYLSQFLTAFVIVSVVDRISEQFVQDISPKLQWEPSHNRIFTGSGKGFLISALIAAVYELVYLIFHPLLLALILIIPPFFLKIVVCAILILLALDFLIVIYAVRTGNTKGYHELQAESQQERLGATISNAIWRRLQKTYPGIQKTNSREQSKYIFAKGVCPEKLIWVFLVCALLGDIIETLYCGFVDGQWMNRSSVLYGPFSFVWGFGAVVLTITLQRFAEKNDRYVFFAGFVIGGAYEYMCSVFTELVFGTVFWDYSDMPLNIGGRTNVLFCFFWGVLAVVWVKILYPPLSRGIEKLPALAGSVTTWAVVFAMICNGLLTGAAMLRQQARAISPEPQNMFEAFLDRQYNDDFMASRWPNMIVTTNPKS